MTLQKGCRTIMNADAKVLTNKLFKKQRKGVRISANKRCTICRIPLKQSREDAIAFFCGHVYHVPCFKNIFFGEPVKQNPQKEEAEKQRPTVDLKILQSRSRWDPSVHFQGRKIHCILCHKTERDKKKEKR